MIIKIDLADQLLPRLEYNLTSNYANGYVY